MHYSLRKKVTVARKTFFRKDDFVREHRAYLACKHHQEHPLSQFICQLVSAHMTSELFILDLQFAEKSLFDIMASPKYEEFPTAASLDRVLMDCVSGLIFLHEAVKILHNDIKPENLLLHKVGGPVLICDLGLATTIQPDTRPHIGTFQYCSPEVFSDIYNGCEEPCGKSDVFSLGVALCYLIDGARPFAFPKEIKQAYKAYGAALEREARDSMRLALDEAAENFFMRDYAPKLVVGRNVNDVSDAMRYLLVDMLAATPSCRLSACDCKSRFDKFERVFSNSAAGTSRTDADVKLPIVIEDDEDVKPAITILSSVPTPLPPPSPPAALVQAFELDFHISETPSGGNAAAAEGHDSAFDPFAPENLPAAAPEFLQPVAQEAMAVEVAPASVAQAAAVANAPRSTLSGILSDIERGFFLHDVRAPLARDDRATLIALADVAKHVKTVDEVRAAIGTDRAQLEMLDELQGRDGPSAPIRAAARLLLDIVHEPTCTAFGSRQRVFLLLTGYSQNWWKSSTTMSKFRASK